jgi:hypothetical protein
MMQRRKPTNSPNAVSQQSRPIFCVLQRSLFLLIVLDSEDIQKRKQWRRQLVKDNYSELQQHEASVQVRCARIIIEVLDLTILSIIFAGGHQCQGAGQGNNDHHESQYGGLACSGNLQRSDRIHCRSTQHSS